MHAVIDTLHKQHIALPINRDKILHTHANVKTPAPSRIMSAIGLFEALSDAVVVTNHAGLIVDLNPAAESFFCCSLDDVKDSASATLINIEGLSETHPGAGFLTLHENGWRGKATAYIKDGSSRIVDVTIIGVVSDQDDHPPLKIIISRNTAQQQFDHSVKSSELRFRRAADAAPMLIWQSGIDALCNYFNRPWQEFTGQNFEQGTSRNWGDGVHPHDFERCMKIYTQAFAAHESFEMDYRLKRHDGQYRWMLDCGAPRYAMDGGFEGYAGTCVDITERKDLEEALRACTGELVVAGRRKDEFLAMLSHELRNPLAPIANSLAVMRTLNIADPILLKSQAVIERQVEHLHKLVNNLLDVACVARGKNVANMVQVSLNDIIDRAMEISRPKIKAMAHTVELTRPVTPIYLHGDLAGLAQALASILNNAAKFSAPSGRIAVVAGQKEKQAFIAVRDHGIGISKNFQPRLFALFAQADESLARTRSGLGIGLAMAHEIISLHGGMIEAHSEGIGFGSEFTLFLPMSTDASLHTEKELSQVTPTPDNHNFRILLIDDNHDAIESMETLLKLLHYDIRTANDAETGLSTAIEFQPHLILSDIGLPGMNGYQLAPALRRAAGSRKMVLAAATGYGLASDQARSKAAGFDYHLVKPIDADFLLNFVAQQAATY